MDGRAVAAFVLALDDVGVPTEPRLRFQLIAWFTWATAMLNHRWSTPDDVPSDLLLPTGAGKGRTAGRNPMPPPGSSGNISSAHASGTAGVRTRSWFVGDDGSVNRVSVVGNSGSGKSRLAERIAQALDVPYVELDAIHHLPDWRPIDPDVFVARIEEIASMDAWVIDGNYRTVVVDGPVWERADTVVWLDLPRRSVMLRVTRRTLTRIVGRKTLWNGNRESLRNLWSWDPNTSIIRWAWTQHPKYQERYCLAMESPALDHIAFVRLTSHAAADQWLNKLKAATPT